MQGFLRTPWNATSRTTAQDALWQHILDRKTSSQLFIRSTPCARQVMNRIPGNVTTPWARCWGPLHSCSMSGAIYLPAQRNRQPARPTSRPRPPPHPGKATPCSVWHFPAIWNHLHTEDSCGFQWRDGVADKMEKIKSVLLQLSSNGNRMTGEIERQRLQSEKASNCNIII